MSRAPSGLPPGPRMPATGQTLAFAAQPEAFLRRAHERYGDIFSLRFLREGRLVLLTDPAHIRELLTSDHTVARAGLANKFLKPLVGSESVIVLDGDSHVARRRLLLPAFHRERLAGYQAEIRRVAGAHVGRWQDGASFRVVTAMRAMTMEVITNVVLGISDGDRRDEARRVLGALVRAAAARSAAAMTLALGYDRAARNPIAHAAKRPVHRFIDE